MKPTISDNQAVSLLETMMRSRAFEEGLIALQAAGQVVARPEFAGKTIVVVIADTGERYLSTALFEGLLD